MVIFDSEDDLLESLAHHDELVRQCASEAITFEEFCERYGDFYAFYALDGHESDEEERALLERHEARIRPHEVIAYEILGKVCSDEDAQRESYEKAGRFGSAEAVARLNLISMDRDPPR